MSGIKNMIYVLITALSTYAATRMIQSLTDRQKEWIKANKKTTSKEERAAYKAHIQAKRRAILVAALLLNFGILCTFKYLHFLIAQVNTVISSFGASPINDTLKLIIPLGISFYTFQTMGYLVDVYWNKYPAEKNFGRVLLFVSFFPQMTQGPISNYKDLTTELFKETYLYLSIIFHGVPRECSGASLRKWLLPMYYPPMYRMYLPIMHLTQALQHSSAHLCIVFRFMPISPVTWI